MYKIIITFVFLAISLFYVNNSIAQQIAFEKDTFWYYNFPIDGQFHYAEINMTNTTNQILNLNWRMTSFVKPSNSWDIFSICEPGNCYTSGFQNNHNYYINPNDSGRLAVYVRAYLGTPPGTAFVTIQTDYGKLVYAYTSNSAPLSISSSDMDKNNNSLTLYPNPCINQITFEKKLLDRQHVQVYNNIGLLIDDFDFNNQKLSYNTEKLVNGVYCVKVIDAQNKVIETKKITVTHK